MVVRFCRLFVGGRLGLFIYELSEFFMGHWFGKQETLSCIAANIEEQEFLLSGFNAFNNNFHAEVVSQLNHVLQNSQRSG